MGMWFGDEFYGDDIIGIALFPFVFVYTQAFFRIRHVKVPTT